jgi:hypothetical protein
MASAAYYEVNMDKLYSVYEASQILGTGEARVRAWCKSGELEFFQLSSMRISQQQIDTFLTKKVVRRPNKRQNVSVAVGNSSLITENDTGEMSVESLRREISQLCQ